jgi:hypothetical protein
MKRMESIFVTRNRKVLFRKALDVWNTQLITNVIIMDAVSKRTPLYILSLDLRDAFGSIPHELIRRNLLDIGIPENVIKLVMDSYEDAYIQIQTKSGTTERINIGKGIK